MYYRQTGLDICLETRSVCHIQMQWGMSGIVLAYVGVSLTLHRGDLVMNR